MFKRCQRSLSRHTAYAQFNLHALKRRSPALFLSRLSLSLSKCMANMASWEKRVCTFAATPLPTAFPHRKCNFKLATATATTSNTLLAAATACVCLLCVNEVVRPHWPWGPVTVGAPESGGKGTLSLSLFPSLPTHAESLAPTWRGKGKGNAIAHKRK